MTYHTMIFLVLLCEISRFLIEDDIDGVDDGICAVLIVSSLADEVWHLPLFAALHVNQRWLHYHWM